MKTYQLLTFRDLGGIKTVDGKTVKHHRLLRSAQPVKLSADDVEMLKAHNLKSIVDFRTTPEVTTDPIDTIDGVSYTHIDIMGKNGAQAADRSSWMKMLSQDLAAVELGFTETYKEFATSESSREGYGEFLRVCANLEHGAILFHCAAGKDRTGLAAAIILRLLGVSEDDIHLDYLKTMEFHEQIASPYLEKAKASGMTEQQLESMKVIMGVKKEFLSAAISTAVEQYGSFENYVIKGLGVQLDEIERIRNLYLE
jgi:protein-tyrosine phosphatase